MLRRVALWLVIMMLTVFVSAAWAATPANVQVDLLNLRSGPGQAYQVIRTLPQNTALVVLAQSGEWAQVMTSTGQAGWVFGEYIGTDINYQPANEDVVVNVSRLNVRQGPGTSYPVTNSLVEGQLTQVTGRFGEWYQVKINGKVGFIHGDFVTPVTAENPIEGAVSVPLAQVAVDVLNLRGGRGTEFPIITKLNMGTLLAVLEEGTWSRVMLENGVVGFVSSEYIHSVGGQALAKISADMVNQRSGPDTSFSIVATHPAGQTLTFGGLEGSWVKVSSAAGPGYILGSLLSFAFSAPSVDNPLPPVTGNSLAGRKIVIDAGHGGPDPGAIGVNGLREKNINFTMAIKLRDMLVTEGAEVIMTRTGDYTISLEERIAFGHDNGADMFVSIHNNAHPSSSVSGTQVFYGVTSGSFNLGNLVHRRLVGIGLVDKGLLSASFRVLINTRIPAILTETAFLSNPGDAALLGQETFLNSAVQAHFEGIREWFATR